MKIWWVNSKAKNEESQKSQILEIAVTRSSLLHFPHRACLMASVSSIVLLPVAVLFAFFFRDDRFARLLAAGNILGIVIYNAVCASYSRSSVRNISALKAPTTVDGCGGRLILSMCTIFQTASRCPPSRRLLYPRGKIARLLHAPWNCMKKYRIFVKSAHTNESNLAHYNG